MAPPEAYDLLVRNYQQLVLIRQMQYVQGNMGMLDITFMFHKKVGVKQSLLKVKIYGCES